MRSAFGQVISLAPGSEVHKIRFDAGLDTVRYPEFVRRSTAAGTVGYWAFLTGKRVIYFGRKGEQHIEEFPRANP